MTGTQGEREEQLGRQRAEAHLAKAGRAGGVKRQSSPATPYSLRKLPGRLSTELNWGYF
jgi:hypothetical protein